MNEEVIQYCAKELNLTIEQVKTVLSMLEEGATVPFIARYRKERTGALNEDQIRAINEVYTYQLNLKERKEAVIRLIDEKGMLNKEIIESINACEKISQVDEIYRPYKEKKKTRAMIAKENGLEPLAIWILTMPRNGSLEKEAKKFVKDDLTLEDVYAGAKDIIAQHVSENAKYRAAVKDNLLKRGRIVSKEKKKHNDEKKVYQMYYDYAEPISRIANHRILALNRAEKEKVVTITFEYDKEWLINYIVRGFTRNKPTIVEDIIREAATEGFDRLLYPSIEREIRNELTERAQDKALDVFSVNLEKLLLQAPLQGKTVLGVDPGFRTGCKLAVVNPQGKVLTISKFYASLPNKDHSGDKRILGNLISHYGVEIIAIGNGTASRETEKFIADYIKENHLKLQYVIVSEAGASVYSASKIAQEEFPDYQVEERSAVSIARRLQDPLSELVKIEPKAISVGQYQHDMNQKELTDRLDFVVEKAVNSVGVDINTASPSLLQYVSGCSKTIANNIVEYRNENGPYTNRQQLLNVKKLGKKTYEQAVGFLRVMNGDNPLDMTSIHPESYDVAKQILKAIHKDVKDIGNIEEEIDSLDTSKINCDEYTLHDIKEALKAPLRTPRDEYPTALLKSDILETKDLKPGMQLQGTVRNVVDFGAFVDIGLHEDGLVHISKMSTKKVNHPLDICNVGDIVTVYVLDVDDRNRVSLSFIQA